MDTPQISESGEYAPQLDFGAPSQETDAYKVKNWADDSTVRDRIKSEIVPLLTQVRSRRQPLEEMWGRCLRAWTLEHEEQGYLGRSNIYVPAVHKAAETLVTQLVTNTFPGGDFFDVMARREEFVSQANDLKSIMSQRIENTVRLRVHAERIYRGLVVKGNAPIKVFYDRKKIKTIQRGKDGLGEASEATLYDGPQVAPIDIDHFYVFPETANTLWDAEVVFEDLLVPVSRLRAKAREGCYRKEAVDVAAVGGRNPSSDTSYTNTLAAQGISAPQNVGGHYGMVDITEVWLDFDPAAPSREEEENPVPFLITVTRGGEVLRAIENPFWHKRPPYLLARAQIYQDRIYGTGFIEPVLQMQYLLNDQTNQGMDCATYVLNPVVITDPDKLIGPLTEIEPGAQWLARDVNSAIRFDRPPVELVQVSSILSAGTTSQIQDYMGAPPVLSGGSSPGRAFKTATGVGTAQRNAVLPLQEVVRLCEAEVWEPMLWMFWMLDQQFAQDDFLVNVTGSKVQRVRPEDLRGDYMFKWLASTQAANQQIRGGQIVQLLQVLGPLMPLLQAQGKTIDPAPLISKLYTEVYGFRDVDRVIVPSQPPPVQAQPQPPGAPPGAVGGSPVDEALAALMANGGAGGEPDELAALREQAEGLSGQFGMLGASGSLG